MKITLNRRGPVQQPSPDPNEAAYIRPTVLNPPKDCEPKMKMKPSHRVTSCMGDSGGPLVMKGTRTVQGIIFKLILGENGEDLLVGNIEIVKKTNNSLFHKTGLQPSELC